MSGAFALLMATGPIFTVTKLSPLRRNLVDVFNSNG